MPREFIEYPRVGLERTFTWQICIFNNPLHRCHLILQFGCLSKAPITHTDEIDCLCDSKTNICTDKVYFGEFDSSISSHANHFSEFILYILQCKYYKIYLSRERGNYKRHKSHKARTSHRAKMPEIIIVIMKLLPSLMCPKFIHLQSRVTLRQRGTKQMYLRPDIHKIRVAIVLPH